MTSAIRVALIILVLVLLLGAGAWYYLFGPNRTSAADLVPGDTIFFATIPNAARILADYDGSQLKKLVDAPEAQPLVDSLNQHLGDKNLDLLKSFLPELSGQSFLAVTHFDPANPAKIGLIGGLKPKPGAGNFDDFVAKLRASYPDLLAQGTTGVGQVEGLDYQWIKGPGASDKICIGRHDGWIITAWGEDALRDWWERYEKKGATPSLSKNPGYLKSLDRVGVDSQALTYVDYHAVAGMLAQQIARTNPAAAKVMAEQVASIGAVMIGTKFDNGEIADRFSMLMPRDAQIAIGAPTEPCAFDTMKFTGPDTRFYLAGNVNFARMYKNFLDEMPPPSAANTPANPVASMMVNPLQNWAQSKNLDVQRNIIGPLGNEMSIQAEWSSGNSYPDFGIFVKLDKPDDFKPTVAAIIDAVRQMSSSTAVINELDSNGQKFATLKFIQAYPISPTITEDGPYLGLFLTENQAVNSFKRDASVGLLNNSDFKRQIGDRQKGATQLVFLDSPQLLDRGYQTALPMLSMAAMFNPKVGAMLQGHKPPPDLKWLAPLGTWTFEWTPDQDGFLGYSVSGIGNQGILASVAAGGIGAVAAQFFHPPSPASTQFPGGPSVAPMLPSTSLDANSPATMGASPGIPLNPNIPAPTTPPPPASPGASASPASSLAPPNDTSAPAAAPPPPAPAPPPPSPAASDGSVPATTSPVPTSPTPALDTTMPAAAPAASAPLSNAIPPAPVPATNQ